MTPREQLARLEEILGPRTSHEKMMINGWTPATWSAVLWALELSELVKKQQMDLVAVKLEVMNAQLKEMNAKNEAERPTKKSKEKVEKVLAE